MKKVLVIARAFPPFLPVGHSIRVVKFLKYLPALGWLPVVITVDDKKEYETLRKVGSESLLSEMQSPIKIYRTPAAEPSLGYLKKEREFSQRNRLTRAIVKVLGGARRWTFRNICLPDRYLAWLPFALQRGREIVQSQGINVIFVTCPPHSATVIGACLKRLTKKPLILDFRDDWIDTPWYLSKTVFTRWIERRIEKWVVNTADKVILVTECSQKAFQKRYSKEPESKFILISNGCDLEELATLNSKQAPARNSQFTILHAGSLNVSKSWGRSPAGLFHAMHNISRQQPDLAEKLKIVFAGDLPEDYQQLANERGLSEMIKVLGHVPHRDVLRLSKSADVLLAMNYEGWSTLIPGKIYEYWAIGGPPILLLSCPGAAENLVKQQHLGLTVDPSDAIGIQKAILTIYRQSKTTAPLRVNTAGIEMYDRKALTGKLAQVLSMVCE